MCGMSELTIAKASLCFSRPFWTGEAVLDPPVEGVIDEDADECLQAILVVFARLGWWMCGYA